MVVAFEVWGPRLNLRWVVDGKGEVKEVSLRSFSLSRMLVILESRGCVRFMMSVVILMRGKRKEGFMRHGGSVELVILDDFSL